MSSPPPADAPEPPLAEAAPPSDSENNVAAVEPSPSAAESGAAAESSGLKPHAEMVKPEAVLEAERRLEAQRELNRKRAAKFGTAYVEPKPESVLDKTSLQRLRRQREAGFITGFDLGSTEEQAKMKARAKRFGIEEFDRSKLRDEFAGITEAERKNKEMKAQRAARFGIPVEEDVDLAKGASEALGAGSPYGEVNGAPAVLRKKAIHVRAPAYLAVATPDIHAFFKGFGISWIEWLNGLSFNVLFDDEYTAARVLETVSAPIPSVGGFSVDSAWRICVKPLVKLKTDKYAVRGTLTTVYMRYASNADTKELAKGTPGARTYGTGIRREPRKRNRKRKVQAMSRPREDTERAPAGAPPAASEEEGAAKEGFAAPSSVFGLYPEDETGPTEHKGKKARGRGVTRWHGDNADGGDSDEGRRGGGGGGGGDAEGGGGGGGAEYDTVVDREDDL